MRPLFAAAAICLAAPSLAAPSGDVLFQQGQFGPAATAARAAGDHLLAAKSQLIVAAFQATTKEQALGFLDWALKNGQADAEKLDYVPLPDSVVKQIEASWTAELKDGGKPIWP